MKKDASSSIVLPKVCHERQENHRRCTIYQGQAERKNEEGQTDSTNSRCPEKHQKKGGQRADSQLPVRCCTLCDYIWPPVVTDAI